MDTAMQNARRPEVYDDRGVRRIGYFAVIALIVTLGLWGGLAPLETAALAPGIVEVEGKRKTIEHLEGGIVSEILVSNGEWVSEEQPLLILDTTRYTVERDILQGRIYNQQATVDRLSAEREDLAQVVFRESLVAASLADARASSSISNELALFAARSADRSAEKELLASQKEGLKGVLESKRTVEESLKQEIDDLRDLLSQGYIDKQRLRELERARAQALGELADLQVAIDELELRASQLDKRFMTKVIDELVESMEALYDIERQHAAADDRVRRATIRAPVAGTILNLLPNTIGAVIASGETVLEIVPRITDLVVDVRISPQDIDRVRIGQAAEVRFSVFKDAYLISGQLSKLSPDRLIDAETNLPYYSGEVNLLEEDLVLLDGQSLVPGMPAEVLIKTGERTMLGYVTSPMRRMFSRSLTED